MPAFPVDVPKRRVLRALLGLGFTLKRETRHLVPSRKNADGTETPLVLPNHDLMKGSTLRTALTQAGVDRDTFLLAYEGS